MKQVTFFFYCNHTTVNVGKRLVKTPKLYFYDSGLACSVLGIESSDQLAQHYLRGGLVETLIISELFKQRYNQGRIPRLYFWRDKLGHEIDCLAISGTKQIPMEIKAGKTVSNDYFDGLTYWYELFDTAHDGIVFYAGNENQQRSSGRLVSWSSMQSLDKI